MFKFNFKRYLCYICNKKTNERNKIIYEQIKCQED